MKTIDPSSLVPTFRRLAGDAVDHPSVQSALNALQGMGGPVVAGGMTSLRRAFGGRNPDYAPFGLGTYKGPAAAGQCVVTITLDDDLPSATRLYIDSTNLASIDALKFDGKVPTIGKSGTISSGSVTGTLPGKSIDSARVFQSGGWYVPAGTKTIMVTLTTAINDAPFGAWLLGVDPGVLNVGCRVGEDA